MTITMDTVVSDIRDFIATLAEPDEVIVGLLRYGAHIPHVYQRFAPSSTKFKLLLSHMAGFMPPSYFAGRKFLILDDTVYRGVHMDRMRRFLIDTCGVPKEAIRCAALIVHSSADSKGILHRRRLSDVQYIVWKEELASLVRQDIRPTERDHPLYYFSSSQASVGMLLQALNELGPVHPVGTHSVGDVFRATVTLSTTLLMDVAAELPGFTLDEICKVRFYAYEDNGALRLVAAPIVLPTVVMADADFALRRLALALGLPDEFFDSCRQAVGDTDSMRYYFASRGLAALCLHRVLARLCEILGELGATLSSINPEAIDADVEYEFPLQYRVFHEQVVKRTEEIIRRLPADTPDLFRTSWAPETKAGRPRRVDPLLPDVYQLTAFIAQHIEAACWNGREWLPNYEADVGVTHHQLLREYEDPLFVSRALDELLDSGLLRAKDCLLDSSGCVYGRTFLPGGEFKALAFSRLADAWNASTHANSTIVAEERRELWGPL